MLADGRIFPLSTAGMVCGCAEWPIPGFTDTRRWTGLSTGKRGMVRAGGSASRTIDDSNAPDPGGGKRALGGRPPAWRQPKGGTLIELDGPRMPRAFQLWGASLLLKKNYVIVRFQIAAIWWWRETRRWNRPRHRSWVEVVWLLLGAM